MMRLNFNKDYCARVFWLDAVGFWLRGLHGSTYDRPEDIEAALEAIRNLVQAHTALREAVRADEANGRDGDQDWLTGRRS